MKSLLSKSPIRIMDLNRIRRFNDVRISSDGNDLYWVESVDGKGIIFSRNSEGRVQNISTGFNVGGTVGYGGGDFDISSNRLVFAVVEGGLYTTHLEPLEKLHPITPALENAASPAISPDGQRVLYVFQQGDKDGLAISNISGSTSPDYLTSQADFYMQPTWHPSGDWIAWAEWNHPFMPWDASCVMIGALSKSKPGLQSAIRIAGGQDTAANQPRFSPDGQWLSFCPAGWQLGQPGFIQPYEPG